MSGYPDGCTQADHDRAFCGEDDLSPFFRRMADEGKRCPHCACWQSPEAMRSGGFRCRRCLHEWRPS